MGSGFRPGIALGGGGGILGLIVIVVLALGGLNGAGGGGGGGGGGFGLAGEDNGDLARQCQTGADANQARTAASSRW